MQTYTTQMDAARKGIITPQMEIVAKKEYRTPEEIRQLVAEGKVAIPANKHHECLDPEGIGSMLRTKINDTYDGHRSYLCLLPESSPIGYRNIGTKVRVRLILC